MFCDFETGQLLHYQIDEGGEGGGVEKTSERGVFQEQKRQTINHLTAMSFKFSAIKIEPQPSLKFAQRFKFAFKI